MPIQKIPQSRKWQPTPIFLPGKYHRQRSLEGYSPWGRKESDTAEQLTLFPAIRFLLSSKRYLAILTRLSEVPIKQKEETPR